MRRLPSLSLLFLAVLGCGNKKDPPPFSPPGPGLIYSFPSDGQLDVPLGARLTLAFSEALDESVLARSCSDSGEGGLCVLDGTSLVAGSWSLVGEGARTAEFLPEERFQPGHDYEIYISPQMLSAGVGNVPASGPTLHFTTAQPGNRVGVAATVIAINGDPAETYAMGSTLAPRFPFTSFATFRLVFSEEIDERSAVAGQNVQLFDTGSGAEISGQLLVQGLHMSFDPDEDLPSGTSYELRITSSLRDLGGEAVEAQSFFFAPEDVGEINSQILDVSPGLGDDDFPAASSVSSLARNQVSLSSTIIGDNIIELKDGQVELFMAQNSLFPSAVPVVIRKGQALLASGLKVALAGTVNSGLDTGDLELSFVSDVTGFLVRNTHWPSSIIPDNKEAPLEVFLSFDVGVCATDTVGNAALTQTTLGVQASGIAEVQDGQLVITTLGSIELDILGITKAPAQMALSLSTSEGLSVATDIDAPILLSSYPKAGEALAELGDSVTLAFSEAVELKGSDAIELRNEFGAAIDADMRAAGSMVVITPSEPLADDVEYAVFINAGLRDLNGNSWRRDASDPTAGEGVLRFRAAPVGTADTLAPTLLGIYPGVPCALEGQDSGARRCQGGASEDTDYLPFQLPANHNLELLFDKPLQPESVALGTACGQGSIRVEQVSGQNCDAAVPGLVHVSERGIQFVPEDPWQEGASYRLVVVAGGNASCGAEEICGTNGLALNTDPLRGNGAAGGPDLEVDFVGAAASKSEVAVTGAQPIVDSNGNGKVDGGETEVSTNRAAVRVAGFSGIVSSASIATPDCDDSTLDTEGCMYMSSDLVVTLGEGQDDCVINSGGGTVSADHCIPAVVSPGAIYGTELTMDASVLGLGLINDLKTGRVILRVREGSEPVVGYIVEDASGQPEILLTLSVYMDAPDLSILGGLASHDLHSKELRVSLRGPVTFRDDGRLKISVANEELVAIDVNVSALGLNTGSMSLEIGPGQMTLDLVSRAARGGQR